MMISRLSDFMFVKNPFTKKKRLKFKLRRKYVLNLLKEYQHLAKTKTPKLFKIPNKGQQTCANESSKQTKITPKMSSSVLQCQGQSSLT